MSTTTTQYEVVGTTQDVTQCQQCGRDDLRGTIALAVVEVTTGDDGNEEWNHTGEVVYYGSDCGAKAAGYGTGKGRQLRAEAEAADRAAARQAEMLAERRTYYGQVVEFLATGSHGPEDIALRARQTFHRSGGFDVLGPFPAWVAQVAETGKLD